MEGLHMLNTQFNRDAVELSLVKYLDTIDFDNLSLSKSGKSYSVSYDRIEFTTKEGVVVKGALSLYAPKDDYEDFKYLRDKGKEERQAKKPSNDTTMPKDDMQTMINEMVAKALEKALK